MVGVFARMCHFLEIFDQGFQVIVMKFDFLRAFERRKFIAAVRQILIGDDRVFGGIDERLPLPGLQVQHFNGC